MKLEHYEEIELFCSEEMKNKMKNHLTFDDNDEETEFDVSAAFLDEFSSSNKEYKILIFYREYNGQDWSKSLSLEEFLSPAVDTSLPKYNMISIDFGTEITTWGNSYSMFDDCFRNRSFIEKQENV